jgi:hypothetical protein
MRKETTSSQRSFFSDSSQHQQMQGRPINNILTSREILVAAVTVICDTKHDHLLSLCTILKSRRSIAYEAFYFLALDR